MPKSYPQKSAELRYQALFENTPVSIWEEDFSKVGEWFDELRERGISDLSAYLDENPSEIVAAASLVTITRVNQAALDLIQVDSREKVEGCFGRIFREETKGIFLAELLAIWQGKSHIVLEGQGKSGSDPYDYVLDMLVPEVNGRPSLESVIAVIMDVTPIKAAERARRTALREKEAILSAIPETIFSVDTALCIKESNRPLAPLCPDAGKLNPGESLNTLSENSTCPCREVARRTIETRQPVRGFRARTGIGSSARSLELTGSPLLDGEGRFTGAVIAVRDVTRLEHLEELVDAGHGRQGLASMVGHSRPMQEVYTLLEQVAAVDSTVLITGESGTGKELAAEAVHYLGARASGPLVKVNCSALSENLLESELFGHVRGAFSGAVGNKEGRFQLAQKGTLFLDEIGDISSLIQLKLLRVLESKEFERVGDARPIKADVRIVAATNSDLLDKVHTGQFREDLYYRLKVVNVGLPPLRERREDIPLLASHFIDLFRASMGKELTGLDQDMLSTLMGHSWPGNVRELRHALEHACILSPGGLLNTAHLPPELLSASTPTRRAIQTAQGLSRREHVASVDQTAINQALEETGGSKVKAAKLLGISRASLYRKMAEFKIDS